MSKEEKILDFKSSKYFWLGDSKGSFKIIASLRINSKKKKSNILAFLTSGVVAGNVYSKQKLIKDPPYMFQCIVRKDEEIFLRTDLIEQKSSRKKLLDTHRNNRSRFIKIYTNYVKSNQIKNFEEINNMFFKKNFFCKVLFQWSELEFEMEFPVNHLNINNNNEWQVETGPILFPSNINSNKHELKFLPSFIHFNNFNEFDILIDFPFMKRKTEHKQNILRKIPSLIKLFTIS